MFIHIIRWLMLFFWDSYHFNRSRHRSGVVRWEDTPPLPSRPEAEVKPPAGYTLTVNHQGERLYARSPLPAWAGSYRHHPYANNPYGDILV